MARNSIANQRTKLKQPKQKDSPVYDKPASRTKEGQLLKDQFVIEHLVRQEQGEAIPYFRDKEGNLWYLEVKSTNKKTGVINYGFVDLTRKLEREARYAAKQLGLTPQLELFQDIFGKDIGRQVFLDELTKTQAIYKNYDSDLYDVDHMGSKKFLYPHMARNLNPQKSVYNRSEGARELTPEQENAFRIVKNDLRTTLQLQGPELTEDQKNQVMQRGLTGLQTGSQKQGITPKQILKGIGTGARLLGKGNTLPIAAGIDLATAGGNPAFKDFITDEVVSKAKVNVGGLQIGGAPNQQTDVGYIAGKKIQNVYKNVKKRLLDEKIGINKENIEQEDSIGL